MSEKQPIQTKRIDMTKTSFMANGKEYFITSFLSVARFCEFQIFEKEFAYSTDLKSLFKEVSACHKLLKDAVNFGSVSDVIIKLDNLQRGIARLEEKEPTALKLCSLFINTVDEDPGFWSVDLMNVKIEDFKASGIEMQDFFQLALTSQHSYIDIYKQMSDKFSTIEKKME
jgi:hypothetical protein